MSHNVTGEHGRQGLDDLLGNTEVWYSDLQDLIGPTMTCLTTRHASHASTETIEEASKPHDCSLPMAPFPALELPDLEIQANQSMEKKYRANLNTKFQELQSCLLKSKLILKNLSEEDRKLLCSVSGKDDAGVNPRQAKSLVLQKAISSIELLQGKCRKLTTQIRLLESTIQALQLQMNGMLDLIKWSVQSMS